MKTVRFGEERYVGDPINAVRIFNEKSADEIAIFDIGASESGRQPDLDLIQRLAVESRMPMCYAGGVRTVDQVEAIIRLGVEKVGIGEAARADPGILSRAAERVGSQSVVGIIDHFRQVTGGAAAACANRGRTPLGVGVPELAERFERLGAGEIVINSVDRDGMMQGYDIELAKTLTGRLRVPLTVLGGAGSLAHAEELIGSAGLVGAAAGSMFVFKGRLKAVLINYPTWQERDRLLT